MTISRGAVFQLFKYSVYILLSMNIYWFFAEEYSAAQLQFVDGVGFKDIIVAA